MDGDQHRIRSPLKQALLRVLNAFGNKPQGMLRTKLVEMACVLQGRWPYAKKNDPGQQEPGSDWRFKMAVGNAASDLTIMGMCVQTNTRPVRFHAWQKGQPVPEGFVAHVLGRTATISNRKPRSDKGSAKQKPVRLVVITDQLLEAAVVENEQAKETNRLEEGGFRSWLLLSRSAKWIDEPRLGCSLCGETGSMDTDVGDGKCYRCGGVGGLTHSDVQGAIYRLKQYKGAPKLRGVKSFPKQIEELEEALHNWPPKDNFVLNNNTFFYRYQKSIAERTRSVPHP